MLSAGSGCRHIRRVLLAMALLGLPQQSVLLGQPNGAGCDLPTRSGLPDWFRTWFEAKGPQARFEISCYLNPFYLRGNFDARGQLDLAVLIVERSSGKRGVLVVHRPGLAFYVLGAGTEIGNGGDSFSWLDVWHVDAAPRLEAGRPEAGFVGEVLNLAKSDSASGWVGWNGRKYVWVQGSD
jgi:hypothetical protein